jgi:flagellar basal body-associated protein FliL
LGIPVAKTARTALHEEGRGTESATSPFRGQGIDRRRRGVFMSILWIILIIVIVLALLGFLGRGAW